MKTRTKKSVATKGVVSLLAVAMVGAPVAGQLASMQRAQAIGVDGYKAVLDYSTLAEAQEAAAALNEKILSEGAVLLKNKDNVLPLQNALRVTVFGANASSLLLGQGRGSFEKSVPTSLANAGFIVNPTVVTAANASVTHGMQLYNEVGVVVLSRGGSEGSDLSTRTNENATEEENVGDWEHKALGEQNGQKKKHNQMLTDAELALVEMAKENCKKVVVLLNTSNAMEMYNLEHDDGIDAIMFIGRVGQESTAAVGKLLSGEINPSGKTSDVWVKDLTADPTWNNFGSNVQNEGASNQYILESGASATVDSKGYHGIDYEEGIYLGYKYYETVYADIVAGKYSYNASTKTLTKGAPTNAQQEADAFYADNVVYPFGYGLSYTENFDIKTPTIDKATITSDDASSTAGETKTTAKVKKVTVTVDVENKGTTAGKEVVEIYAQAPYTEGGIEKVSGKLVAYAKTSLLKPGQKETLKIDVNLQDIASYDYDDANSNNFTGYELEAGTYTLYASNSSHVTASTAKVTFQVTGDGAKLQLDDYSDNEIKNLFTDGRYSSFRTNNRDWNGDGTIDDDDKMFSEEQTELSRADFVSTFPKAPVVKLAGADQLEVFSAGKAYAVGDKVQYTVTTGSGMAQSSETKYYVFTAAHAAGAWDATHVKEITDGPFEGARVVTDAFQTLTNYWDVFNLDSWGIKEAGVKVAATADNFTDYYTRSTSGNGTLAIDRYRYTKVADEATFSATTEYYSIDATNTGYFYSDKLFDEDGELTVDVTADMMSGWSQMASSAAQAAAKEEAGDDWISFYDLAGIKYNDTATIEGGKFDGKTGVEVWTAFMNQWTWEDFYTAGWSGGGNGSAVANLGIPAGGAADNPLNWNSTFTWQCNTTLGSTWNVDLGNQQGIITANMGLLQSNGKDQWMTPAINTHRTAFSGRNNEYYSEDGILAGDMAIAVAQGAQSRGVGCHVKHMFLNDQETNRNSCDLFAWLSEQALREIYAKPFQMAIQEGGATGSMTAFARIGSVPVPDSYQMHQLLVRDEWGSTNFMFHTDYYGAQSNVAPVDLMIRAGVNHAPGTKPATNGSTVAASFSGRWNPDYDNTLTGGKGGLIIGKDDKVTEANPNGTGQEAYYSNNQWYLVRLRAMQMYSEYANQAHVQNGVASDVFAAQTVEVKVGANANVTLESAVGSDHEVVATVSGTLPEGLTLSGLKITGTPMSLGETTVTVNLTIDKWITRSAKVTIKVIDNDDIEAVGTGAKVGEAITPVVIKQYSVGDAYGGNSSRPVTAVTRTMSSNIPGLTLAADGTLSGTPTKAGLFIITVTERVTYQNGNRTSTANVTVTRKITIAEGEGGSPVTPPSTDPVQVRVTGEGMIQITMDAGETWIDVIDKADLKGEDGAPGAAGEPGTTPTVEISNDGYWVINGTKTTVKAAGTDGKDGAPGADGKDGVDGKDGGGCGSSVETTSAAVAAAVVLAGLGVALVARKRKAQAK